MMAAVAVFASTAGEGEGGAERLQVNTSSTTINWVGEKVTGSHQGTLKLKSGTVSVVDGVIDAANVVIDMTTIVCTDEGMDAETKGKLVGHLQSPDFFNVGEHKTAQFVLSSFKPMKGENGANYMVTGKLTIKGISQEISFPAKVTISAGKVVAEAAFEIDRTKWDIRYGSGSFFDGLGDKVIYDDMKISFKLVANA
ncbi:MAG: hypothetical protein RL226_422 [Bacteroidota bacterium]